jgi:hypothetical protein
MVHQLCHGRPLAGGYLARTPDYPPINAASAMRRLWLAEPMQPDIFAHQPAAELATLGVRFVVLNLDLDAMSGSRSGRLRELLEAPGIALVARTPALELYALDPAAARPVVMPADGWHPPETDGRRVWRWIEEAAGLRLLARAPALVSVEVAATAYERDRPLALELDGALLAEVRAPAAPQVRVLRFHLLLPAGEHRLTLRSEAEPAPDGRRLSLSVSRLAVTGRILPLAPGQRVVALPPTLAPGPDPLCRT